MVTTAFWVCGYWRTGSSMSARSPSTKINELTTIASTGLRMKMSVKFIACALDPWPAPRPASMLLWRRVWVLGRFHAVVDAHRRTILQLDLATADHFGARIEPAEDCDLIAPGGTGGHEGLLDHQRIGGYWRWSLAGLLRRVLVRRIGVLGGGGLFRVELALGPHDVDRFAIRVVDDCGLRQRQITLLRADIDCDVDEHTRAQDAIGIRHARFDQDIARVGVDFRIHGIDRAAKALARKCIQREFGIAADL